ncbi:hypothetical protein IWQ56_005005, partial [Coemansia nantahalensis]
RAAGRPEHHRQHVRDRLPDPRQPERGRLQPHRQPPRPGAAAASQDRCVAGHLPGRRRRRSHALRRPRCARLVGPRVFGRPPGRGVRRSSHAGLRHVPDARLDQQRRLGRAPRPRPPERGRRHQLSRVLRRRPSAGPLPDLRRPARGPGRPVARAVRRRWARRGRPAAGLRAHALGRRGGPLPGARLQRPCAARWRL